MKFKLVLVIKIQHLCR